MHKLGILGRFEMQLLRELVCPGMTVVDVGANQGIYTLTLAGLARPGPSTFPKSASPDRADSKAPRSLRSFPAGT